MANPVWSQLAKSLSDSSTIDQAITAVIAEHNSDPAAHLAEGAALAAHKSYEVIDHPAGSIPYDKKKFSELQFKNYFTGATLYDHDGSVIQNGNGTILVETFHGSPGYSSIQIDIPLFTNYSFPEKEIVFSISALFNWFSTSDVLSMLLGDKHYGFGLEVNNNLVTCVLYNNDTEYRSTPIEFTKSIWQTFRFHIDPNDGLYKVYQNDQFVFSVNLPLKIDPFIPQLVLICSDTLTSYADITIAFMELSYYLDQSS